MCALPCSESSDMHPSTVFAFERPTKLCTFDSPSLRGASCRETDEGIFDLVSLSLTTSFLVMLALLSLLVLSVAAGPHQKRLTTSGPLPSFALDYAPVNYLYSGEAYCE